MVELRNEVAQLRTEIRTEFATVRDEFGVVRGEMAAVDERLTARIEDSRRETRVLHEDVIARIALLGEGLATQGQALASLSSDTKAIFDTLTVRLTVIEDRLPVTRRRKRTV